MTYSIHQHDDLQDQLILPEVVTVLEDDRILFARGCFADEEKR